MIKITFPARVLGTMLCGMAALALSAGPNLVKNAGFEEGNQHWHNLNEGCEVVAGAGLNGSSAMRVTRTSFDQPRVVIKQTVPLKTGKRYKVGGWMRIEAPLKVADRDADRPIIGLEYWQKGRYGGWVATFDPPTKPQTEWQYFETEYIAGDEKNATFLLMLLTASAKTVGVWYYDDICVEEVPGYWDVALVYPMQNKLPPTGGEAIFMSVFSDIPLRDQRINLQLMQGDKVLWSRKKIAPKGYTFTLNLPPLPPGFYQLNGSLYDAKSGQLKSRTSQEVQVAAQAVNKTTLDKKGNLLINGKKFLPVGAYTASLSKKTVDDLIDAGFNCALTYNTIWLSTDDRDGKLCNFQTLRETLDYCAEKNFKVVLSLCMFDPIRSDRINQWDGIEGRGNVVRKLAEDFRDHPALMAWYTTDEPTRGQIKWNRTVRGILNKYDPNHPVFVCLNTLGTVPAYAEVADIVSYDTYPIQWESNIQSTVMAARIMKEYNLPFWWVGQIMSWKHYKSDNNLRYPTEEEMLAQNLMVFIMNCKGIMNYHAAHKVLPQDQVLSGQRHGDWRRMNRATAALADFILSDAPVPEYRIKVTSGHLEHRLFSDGQGNYRLLLVAPFEGETKARIKLPSRLQFVRSERYTVTPAADGFLEFSGRDVTCDILHFKAE